MPEVEPISDWRGFVTDELKADPVVSGFVEKASEKDIPALIKGYAHATKRLGSAINLPAKDAKLEDVNAIKHKIYESGLFTAPPAKPDEYGVTKPEKLPDGLGWSDDLSARFASTLHKHGAPKALAKDLLDLYQEALLGAQGTFKGSYDEGMRALKTEHGDHYEARAEAVKRLMPSIFKTDEELDLYERLGLGNHPGFLGPLLRLAPLAMQDSSFMKDMARPGGEMTGEQVRTELADIMGNKENPKHKAYWQKDPATLAYVEELYKKAYGNEPVVIGQGMGAGVKGA